MEDVVISIMFWVIIIVILIQCFLKLTIRPCTSEVCLVGKTALITGGNRGIGFEVALALATRGCKIIIACRSNAEEAKEDIIRRTHNPSIVVKHLDLTSLNSVRRFCKEIQEKEEKIDILINNAGIGVEYNKYTKDELHPTMQTNLFGPFLLTHLLIDLLKKSKQARIIFVSSIMSFVNNLTVKNLNACEGELLPWLDSLRIYGNSKVGQIIVSNEFSERLKPYGIVSNALHPGVIKTEIYDRVIQLNIMSTLWHALFCLARTICFRNRVDGAQRCIEMAVSDSFEGITGTFYWLFNFPPSITKNREFRRKIWRQIEEYVNLSEEEKIDSP